MGRRRSEREQEGPPRRRTRGTCDLERADAARGQDVVTKDQEEVMRGRQDHKEVTIEEDLEDQKKAIKTGPRGR